jgi:hypothetical protein
MYTLKVKISSKLKLLSAATKLMSSNEPSPGHEISGCIFCAAALEKNATRFKSSRLQFTTYNLRFTVSISCFLLQKLKL